MKVRNLIGFALIGGALYAHKKHGGEWNVDSFKRSAQDLLSGIQHGTRRAAEAAKEAAERAQHRAAEVTERVAGRVEQASQTAEQSVSGGDGNLH